jgi:hypothetical protein
MRSGCSATAHFHCPEGKAVQWSPFFSEARRNGRQVNPEFWGVLFHRFLPMRGIATQHLREGWCLIPSAEQPRQPSLKCFSRRLPGVRVIGAMLTDINESQ